MFIVVAPDPVGGRVGAYWGLEGFLRKLHLS